MLAGLRGVAPRLVIVGPSAVGDWGLGVKSKASLVGVGAQCSNDLGPAVAVGAGVVDQVGQPSFGLLDETGDQRDAGQVIAEPDSPAIGQRGDGVVDEGRRCPRRCADPE